MSTSIYTIYLITNNINNKKYVGQTIRTLEERWGKHISSANGGSKFQIHNAIRKYGKDNFTVESIHKCADRNDLNSMEKYYIKKYDTLNNGYNMTKGGEDNPMRYESSRKRISEHRKQNYWCSGFAENNPMFKGYYVTPWGTAATVKELSDIIGTVHRTTLVRWCRNQNNKPFCKKAVAMNKYLQNLDVCPVGKTPKELGFGFIWTR